MRRAVLALLIAACAAAGPLPAQRRPVPTPASVLGFAPGADRKLASWPTIVTWFKALAAASGRVQIREIGRSTDGAPFVVAFISSPANLARLPALGLLQRQLADPRVVPESATVENLVRRAKVFVLVTAGVHSTEVGGSLSAVEIAYRLATDQSAEIRAVLDRDVVVLVPALNPDGVSIVARWYDQTLGTPAEGSDPPGLYNRYTGHDDNRDWYAFTQVETRLVVDSLYDVWHPQVVLDLHQQGRDGSRLFIPPYVDPVEPNVDPLLVAGEDALGLATAWRLTADGFTGVAVNTLYDAWSPSRAFEHYHAAVRILAEAASASLASPVTVPPDSLRPVAGLDPSAASWNFVAPWPGGTWALGDIVRYQTEATLDLLSAVAANRESWVRDAHRVAERAVRGWEGWPWAFVIPTAGQNQAALGTLLEIFRHAQVEVRAALGAFTIGHERFYPGTYVVVLRQPYAAFAKSMLERQSYPDLREYPGGPPRRPYDVTAHTLPLLLGVRALAVADSLPVALSAPVAATAPAYRVDGLTPDADAQPSVRTAVYRSYAAPPDEGWTRWVFDTWKVPYQSVVDSQIRAGALADRYDAIILPDQDPAAILSGLPADRYPPGVAGGVGSAGVQALRDFVDAGGTLIALNQACDFAIGALDLPLSDAVLDVAPRGFFGPGSILRLQLDPAAPLSAGMPAQTIAWFEGGPAFDVTDPARVRVVGRYPAVPSDVLLSGWLLGASYLAGKAALVEVRRGRGRVILFGFRPQYRGQSLATLPLLFNAIRSAKR